MSELNYLSELLREKMMLELLPVLFPNADRLVEGELARVRSKIYHADFHSERTTKLPEPTGELVLAIDKVYVPAKEHPDYNFVGRILGPRGMTAKELERGTGCKIMIRGKGSMRDTIKEKKCQGKPNYEHLDDDLHVLIQCEDTQERAAIKIADAVDQVTKLLVPPKDKGIDELKRKQLMELAILNGTYRPPLAQQKSRPMQSMMPVPQQQKSMPYVETSSGGTSSSTSNGSPLPYVPPARRRSQMQMEFSAPPPQLTYFPPPMSYCLSPPRFPSC